MDEVIVGRGLQASYDALTVKDPRKIYICVDTKRIYLGSRLLSDDTNTVHITGAEEITGIKTFIHGLVTTLLTLVSGDDGNVFFSLDSDTNDVIVNIENDNGNDVVMRGIRPPKEDNDAANKGYVDERTADVSDKADKVDGATSGNFAGLDSNGNLNDSGKKAADFATAAQGAKADTAVQSVTIGTTTTGAAGTNASVNNSGTATNPVLNFTIPRGSDGSDAVNPFKGWWPSSAALIAAKQATAGDYAYVIPAVATDPVEIWEYDSTSISNNYWHNSGRTFNPANNQEFQSGENLNEVSIINDFTDNAGTVADGRQVNLLVDKTLIEGKNLLYLNWTDGKYYKNNGEKQTGGNYHLMDIPCNPNTDYFLSAQSGNLGGSSIYVGLWNDGKVTWTAVSDTNRRTVLIHTAADTKYIAVSCLKTANNVQLELGTSRTTYEAPVAPTLDVKIKGSMLPIVDNLTSGGNQKVLSAEQGKKLSSVSKNFRLTGNGTTQALSGKFPLLANHTYKMTLMDDDIDMTGATQGLVATAVKLRVTTYANESDTASTGYLVIVTISESLSKTYEFTPEANCWARLQMRAAVGAEQVFFIEDLTEPKEIEDLTLQTVYPANILNPSSIKVGVYVSKGDGVERTGSSSINIYGCTEYLEYTEDGLVINYGVAATGTYGCGGCYYSESREYLGHFSASALGRSVAVSGLPATAKYVRFNLAPQSYIATGENYGVYRSTILPEYSAWFEPYRMMKDAVIGDGSVTIDKIAETDVKYITNNVCDPNDCYFGNDKYIRRDNGNVGSFTASIIGGYSGFIPIDSMGLTFTNILYAGSIIGGAVYDANKQFIRSAGSNGKVAYQNGDAYVRFTFASGVTAENAMVNKGLSPKAYEPYQGTKKVISPDILPDSGKNFEEYLETEKIYSGRLDLLLPQKFYYVKGDTLQLFFKGIVKAIGLENRYVKATCEYGKQYKRYLEIPAGENVTAGNKNLTFKVYDDNENILGSGSTVLKVVNAPVSPATEKHILCVGSSTLEGGQWACEAQRRLLATDGTPQGKGLSNIVFVGNQQKTLYGQTAKFYGKSGWSWRDFATEGRGASSFRFYLSGTGNQVVQGNQYTNNGHTYTVTELNTIEGVETILCSTDSSSSTPMTSGTLTPISGASYPSLTYTNAVQDSANLFWDSVNNRLNFTNYVNTYCGGSIDIVYTMLGVNELFRGADVQEMYVRDFVEQLHTEYPNCIIVLATDAYPSMVNMMPGYGASGDQYSNTYRVICEMFKVFSMYKRLANEYDYVEFELWAAQVDSDYNFPLTMKNVNTRNSEVQEPYANNTIHPGNGTPKANARGYMQEADAAYRSIVAHFCQ